jgi:hypothetical protein
MMDERTRTRKRGEEQDPRIDVLDAKVEALRKEFDARMEALEERLLPRIVRSIERSLGKLDRKFYT